MKCFQFIGYIVVFSALVAGAASPISADTPPPSGSKTASVAPIQIGVILPLTGAFARYGSKIQESIQKFSDETFVFHFDDEGCDPKKAISAFKNLAERQGIRLFLGPWCGSPQAVVAPLLKSTQSFALLGSSAPRSVFELSGGRMFSTQPSIEEEAKFLAKQMNARSVQSTVLVFYENQFSRTHEAEFRKHFAGKIFETFAYESDGIAELKAIAMRIRQLNPDAVFVPDAFPLMGGLLRQLRELGVRGKPVYSVYSAQSEDVSTVLGADGENLHYSYPDIGDDDALEFFPEHAARILAEIAFNCAGEVECVWREFTRSQDFTADGTLEGGFVLKTIRDGKFVLSK